MCLGKGLFVYACVPRSWTAKTLPAALPSVTLVSQKVCRGKQRSGSTMRLQLPNARTPYSVFCSELGKRPQYWHQNKCMSCWMQLCCTCRPFPIIVGSIIANSQEPVSPEGSKSPFVSAEFTPEYVGVPAAVPASPPNASVGGGLVEPVVSVRPCESAGEGLSPCNIGIGWKAQSIGSSRTGNAQGTSCCCRCGWRLAISAPQYVLHAGLLHFGCMSSNRTKVPLFVMITKLTQCDDQAYPPAGQPAHGFSSLNFSTQTCHVHRSKLLQRLRLSRLEAEFMAWAFHPSILGRPSGSGRRLPHTFLFHEPRHSSCPTLSQSTQSKASNSDAQASLNAF